MSQPFISVIIPVKELSNVLFQENLPAMNTQTYHNFEVIILPNHKSLKDIPLLSEYKWLRIIPTNKITRPAKKRDIGVKKAKGDIVAFIDDDAYPHQEWLQNAVKLFDRQKITAVCGPGILPPTGNIWEKIFDEVLKTWIGSGGFSYRFIQQKKRYIDDYPSMNFFVLKKDFLDIGGFNNNYWPGEDSKLCEDLVYKKHRLILYSPHVVTYHHRRNNLPGYLEQHANYGFHRGAFFAHGDRNSRRLSYLIPTFFVSYLFFLIVSYLRFSIYLPSEALAKLGHPSSIIFIPLFIYLIFMLHLSIRSFFNTKNILIALLSPLVLFLTHLTYGILFMRGFVKGLISKEKIYG